MLKSVTVSSNAANNRIDVNTNTVTQQFTATPVFDKGADVCGGKHINPATHDKEVSYSWSMATAVAGVSVSDKGLLTINRSKLPVGNTPIRVNATATVKSDNAKQRASEQSATGSVTVFALNNVSCSFVISGVTMNGAETNINATTTPSVTYNATVAGTATCSDPSHTATGVHTSATWSMSPKVVGTDTTGISMSPAGVLSINKDQIKNPSTIIVVTATAGTYSVSTDVTITKVYNCTKKVDSIANFGVITPGTKAPASAQLENRRNDMVFALPLDGTTTATATLQFAMGANKPVFSGECEYEKNNVAAQCPNLKNHQIIWTTDKTYSGISMGRENGILTVTRDSLAAVETAVKVIATIDGISPVTPLVREGYIVVRKGRYSGSSGSDNDDRDYEAERIEAIYDKLEAKIEDADRRDTIKADLSTAPDVPSRILRDFKGTDVNLELYMGDGFTWRVNGKDLKSIPQYQIYLPLGVKRIRDSDISEKAKDKDVKIFEIQHDGSLYGTYKLGIDLDSDYAKKTLYLYKHLDSSSKLSYKGAAKADEDGYVTFPFTSASTYVLTDRPLYGETANTVPSGGGTTTGGGTTGGTGGGTTATVTPAPPPVSVAPSTSSSASSTSSTSETSSDSEIISSSSEEPSKPADAEPEEEKVPEKKKSKIPIIVPILIVVVTITVVAVVLLAKGGGMNVG